jgi:hypothetical protein
LIKHALLTALVLLVVDSVPTRALAQSMAVRRADTTLYIAIARLDDTRRPVRVITRGLERVEGRGISIRDDSVLVVSDNGVRSIPAPDVDAIYVRRGTAALTGGLLAAIPCALFGGLLGAAIATDPDSNGRPGRGAGGALLGAALLGAPCGVLGAGIGSLIKHWQLEYVRPPNVGT